MISNNIAVLFETPLTERVLYLQQDDTKEGLVRIPFHLSFISSLPWHIKGLHTGNCSRREREIVYWVNDVNLGSFTLICQGTQES